jgi:hypothetical protein
MYKPIFQMTTRGNALYTILLWTKQLLTKYPDQHPTTTGTTPSLLIPMDKNSVINDLECQLSHMTSTTYQYLHTDYDILQAIHTLIPTLSITITVFHV